MKKNYEELLAKAQEASKNSYAPYSNYHVGACILYESGREYSGCNVENSSYGLSLCAERNAMSNAIINGEKTKLETVAIFCDSKEHIFVPCGACRQWFVEFGTTPDFKVVIRDREGKIREYGINELLPNSFEL